MFCSLQDSLEKETLRNDMSTIRRFVKEQLEAQGYTEIDLRTIAYAKRIEIVRAKKNGDEIKKLQAAGIGRDGLGFMDGAVAAKVGINEQQATAEIRCLLR